MPSPYLERPLRSYNEAARDLADQRAPSADADQFYFVSVGEGIGSVAAVQVGHDTLLTGFDRATDDLVLGIDDVLCDDPWLALPGTDLVGEIDAPVESVASYALVTRPDFEIGALLHPVPLG